jgi:SH3-like domain-containing protein
MNIVLITKSLPGKTTITALMFVLLFFAGTVGEAAAITMVSVAGEKVNMRKGPSTKYSIKWELGKGFPLRVIGSQGNWLKVSDFESDVGWVYKKRRLGV